MVFCCCATGATDAGDCRLLEDYLVDSFVLSFIRFSCRFVYPKQLLSNEGSQLVKGYKNHNIFFIATELKYEIMLLTLEYAQ